MTLNEESYYARMSSTMNAKCQALFPYLFNGIKLLDFGAGRDESIAEMVKSFNGTYTAVDSSKQVQEFFEEKGITCYSSLTDVMEQYDIIFMSSVYHELLSYLNPLEVAVLTNKLANLIKDNGKIIIRDWNTLPTKEWHQQEQISYNPESLKDITTWIKALQNKGIIENNELLKIGNGKITGSRNDLYNIIYHSTWGLPSIHRESQENYAITYESILRYFYNNSLEITSKTTKWDDSYINYMKKYFTDYGTKIKSREEWLAPKNEIIIQKKQI